MKKITIGLIGLGTVGAGVAKLIKSRAEFVRERFGVDMTLKTACDLKVAPDVRKILSGVKITKDFNDILKDPEINVVVELIGGLNVAHQIIKGAIENDKHVVTANKAVISNFGRDLFRLAHEKSRAIYFESSVLAGVPIIKTLVEGIAGNRYNGIYGIVNGTCNYILSEMSHNGLSFDEALKLAQAKGYAESDPTLDVNGMDSAHKLAILVAMGMGRFVRVKDDIHTEGITQIAAEDLTYAKELGLTIKLLAIAKKREGRLELRVHPTLISMDHPLASIHDVYNAVLSEADAQGDVLLVGKGAGQMAAASGVFSDLINLGQNNECCQRPWVGNNPEEIEKLPLKPMGEVETEFYIRLSIIDKPGVLHKITGILGALNISIAAVSQKQDSRYSVVPLVILTHDVPEAAMRKALDQIAKLKEVKAKPVAIRKEHF